jgi:hypothetical protein
MKIYPLATLIRKVNYVRETFIIRLITPNFSMASQRAGRITAHRNLKSRCSKKGWEKKCPRYECPNTIRVLNTLPLKIVAGKYNLLYEVGRSYLGNFLQNVFTFRLPDFRFLCLCGRPRIQGLKEIWTMECK